MTSTVHRHDGSTDDVTSVRHRDGGVIAVTRDDGTRAIYSPSGWTRVELGVVDPVSPEFDRGESNRLPDNF